MSECTRYDTQFESSPQRESYFLLFCKLISPFSEMAVLLKFNSALTVVGLFYSKSDCMGRARTSPELRFHEVDILEPEIVIYVTVSATLPS